MKKIKYACPTVTEEDIKAVSDVLRSGTLTQGKETKLFEKEVAKYVGSRYAVTFNSATSALLASYACLGMGPDTEVHMSPVTFMATANVAKKLGAKVWFQDREVVTGEFVVPVHYAGVARDFYGETVVEDAAHALGSCADGKKVGSCAASDIVVFSTHAIKNITTGEGGIATTNESSIYEYLKAIRDHGRVNRECQYFGYNFRLTEMQAALGRSQLRRLDVMREAREEIFNFYNKHLAGYVRTLPERNEATYYHLYPVNFRNKTQRDGVQKYLKHKGIETQIHYRPVYLEPAYAAEGWEAGLCPNAEAFWKTELSLPMHNSLSHDDIQYVVDCVRKGVEKCKK